MPCIRLLRGRPCMQRRLLWPRVSPSSALRRPRRVRRREQVRHGSLCRGRWGERRLHRLSRLRTSSSVQERPLCFNREPHVLLHSLLDHSASSDPEMKTNAPTIISPLTGSLLALVCVGAAVVAACSSLAMPADDDGLPECDCPPGEVQITCKAGRFSGGVYQQPTMSTILTRRMMRNV